MDDLNIKLASVFPNYPREAQNIRNRNKQARNLKIEKPLFTENLETGYGIKTSKSRSKSRSSMRNMSKKSRTLKYIDAAKKFSTLRTKSKLMTMRDSDQLRKEDLKREESSIRSMNKIASSKRKQQVDFDFKSIDDQKFANSINMIASPKDEDVDPKPTYQSSQRFENNVEEEEEPVEKGYREEKRSFVKEFSKSRTKKSLKSLNPRHVEGQYRNPLTGERPSENYFRKLYRGNHSMSRTASNLYKTRPRTKMVSDDHDRYHRSKERFKKPGYEKWTRRVDRGKIVDAMRVLSKKGL